MAQTLLAPLFQEVVLGFDSTTGTFFSDFSAVQTTILSSLSSDRAAALTELAEFNRSVHDLGLDTGSSYAAFRSALVAQGTDVAATFPYGTHIVQGTVGNDVITAWAGNQTVYGNGGHDTLIGGAGSEVFYGGGSGDTTFIGGPGNESFYGGASGPAFDGPGDTFIASGGESYYFQGATDNDTDIFTAGGGTAKIYDFGGNDTLELGAGLTAASVVITGASTGRGLIITDGIATDQIDVTDLYESFRAIAESLTLIYGDDTSVDLSHSEAAFFSTTGTTGNDTLYGSLGADVFDSKGGNDIETGFGGGDTFIYNLGYGQLEVNENSNGVNEINVLRPGAGITPAQVTVRSDTSGDLIVTDGTAGDQVKLVGELNSLYYGVQQVQFADGTTWSRQQLLSLASAGTTGNDTLYGTSGADVFDGKGGNDYEQGNGGGDTFIYNRAMARWR
jgi:Ca2+-binding RTX toxin-like protein